MKRSVRRQGSILSREIQTPNCVWHQYACALRRSPRRSSASGDWGTSLVDRRGRVVVVSCFLGGSSMYAQQRCDLKQPDSQSGYAEGTLSLITFNYVSGNWTIEMTCTGTANAKAYNTPDVGVAQFGVRGAFDDSPPAIGASPQYFVVAPGVSSNFEVHNQGGTTLFLRFRGERAHGTLI